MRCSNTSIEETKTWDMLALYINSTVDKFEPTLLRSPTSYQASLLGEK